MQHFIGVDIPNPSKHPLIQEHCLNHSFCSTEVPCERLLIDFKSIRADLAPEPGVKLAHGAQRPEASKSSWVTPDQTHGLSTTRILQVPDHMTMCGCSRYRRDLFKQQGTTHPQPELHHPSVIDFQSQPLAMAMQHLDSTVSKQGLRSGLHRNGQSNDVRSLHQDTGDFQPEDPVGKSSSNVFDFGQLRHESGHSFP
ncbi:MAG: hypothetical protein P8J45_01910 [Phycisphaerales bacterium]|nr:hypothetical protein [Phycisphaerales bacterium]